MLEQTNKPTLSKEEVLAKSFEETDKSLQQFRLDEDFENVEKRLGQPMTHQDLVRRVTKCNPDLWVEDSIAVPGYAGFYTMKEGKKTFLCWFEKGWLPEFSIIFCDAAGLPNKEKRGWRTVLVRLMAAQVLTWKQVLAIFGDAHGSNSKYWAMLTRDFRNV